jgi:hypothetical protein
MKRKTREIEFCQKEIKPLLEAMSPYVERLRYRHGNVEFGKDFTFSYVNPLNQRINVGLQVKWGDIKGASKSLMREIVDQIKVAFKLPYRNSPDEQEVYINELYLVCSGKYTDNAINIIEKTLEKGYNVHFLDCSAVELLRKKATMQKTKEKGETRRILNSLLIELDQNVQLAKFLHEQMEWYIKEKAHPIAVFRFNCLEKMLELDIDNKTIIDNACAIWTRLNIENRMIEEMGFSQDAKKKVLDDLKIFMNQMENFKNHIAQYLDSIE